MIELFERQKSYNDGSGKDILAFVDGIYMCNIELKYKINPEYNVFMEQYELMDKKQKNEVHCPTKWLFDCYYPLIDYNTIPFYSDVLKERRYHNPTTLQQLEYFLIKTFHVENFIKNQGNNLVPIQRSQSANIVL